jgi:hypothetical protein
LRLLQPKVNHSHYHLSIANLLTTNTPPTWRLSQFVQAYEHGKDDINFKSGNTTTPVVASLVEVQYCPVNVHSDPGGYDMFTKEQKMNKKGFRPFLGLVSWWKGRKFYFAQHEDHDGEKSTRNEEKDERAEEPAGGTEPRLPQDTYFNPPLKQQQLRYPLTRSLTVDSFQDSIESMDSLAESYWDPGDETSQSTTPISNTGYQTDFLVEHLGFLSAQTQPREVEVVYRN